MIYEYYINLDERGEFYADVRKPSGETVWETNGEVFEDGFMRHKHDVQGLESYLQELGIITAQDTIARCN